MSTRWERDTEATAQVGERLGPLTSSALGSFPQGQTLETINRRAAGRSRETGWNAYDEVVERRLDEVAAAWVIDAFVQLGCAFDAGATLDIRTLGGAGTDDWRESLRTQLCELLERQGYARRARGHWEATGVLPPASAASLSSELQREFPRHELDVALLNRCGPRIADVLAGRADGRDVLFGDEGFALLERFYRESPASAFYNSLAAEVIADLVSGPSERPVRVLEVGAGTGGTTAHVLPRLTRPNRYVFSDASPLFVERAREKFRQVATCSCRLLDMTQDPHSQGFDNGLFDIVFAANALHAVPDVEHAMRRLTDLVVPWWRADPAGDHPTPGLARHRLWADERLVDPYGPSPSSIASADVGGGLAAVDG